MKRSDEYRITTQKRRYVAAFGIKFYEHANKPEHYFIPGEKVATRDELQAWATERGDVLRDGEDVV